MQPASTPSIVVVGSANTDLVLHCPHLPHPGESVAGARFSQCPGGKGANQAVAAARAGARVAFVGARGDDAFGRASAAALESEGVDVRFFEVLPDVSSGVAFIFVGDDDGQNMIGVAASANDRLAAKSVQAARELFEGAACVVSQLEVSLEAVMMAGLEAKRNGAMFVLNPAPVPVSPVPRPLWKTVDLATPNEEEALLLSGKATVEEAAKWMLEAGCRRVVVSLGAKGARLYTAKGSIFAAPPPVTAVDTVGAGDCLTAWLAVGLAEGLDDETNLYRAVAAASLSVTRMGAQSGMPKRGEV
jgi:ribokinase